MAPDSEPTADDPVTVGVDAADYEDVAAFTTPDGDELVVYRRTDDRAWLQSSAFVALGEMR